MGGEKYVAVLGPASHPETVQAEGTAPRARHERRLPALSEDSSESLAREDAVECSLSMPKRYKMELFDPSWFQPDRYYNATQDQSDINAYYAEFEGRVPNYARLSDLLQRDRRFGGRSQLLMAWFDRHPDGTVKCVYTGTDLSDPKGALLQRANEEHCVPQSWQASKEAHTGRDVYDMYMSSTSANSHRGNRPFGAGTRFKTVTDAGEYSSLDGLRQELFCPKYNKGACARSTLYIMVAYPKALDRARVPEVFLPWLVETAASEPVTLWEKHRNMVGFKHQGNRNPFTDYPEWATALDFSGAWAE